MSQFLFHQTFEYNVYDGYYIACVHPTVYTFSSENAMA